MLSRLLSFTKSSEAPRRVVITAICWVWRLPPDASLLLTSSHLSPISSHCLTFCTHMQERSLHVTKISQTTSFAAARNQTATYHLPRDADALHSRGGFPEKTGLEAHPRDPADSIATALSHNIEKPLDIQPKFIHGSFVLGLVLSFTLNASSLSVVFACFPWFLFHSDSQMSNTNCFRCDLHHLLPTAQIFFMAASCQSLVTIPPISPAMSAPAYVPSIAREFGLVSRVQLCSFNH